jgi:hypothetical protein
LCIDKRVFNKVRKLWVRLAAVTAAVAGGYCLVENRQLRVNEYELRSGKLPKGFDGCRIILLADLHKKRYGDSFSNLINSVEAAEPDFIFFAGDIYSRDEKDLQPALILMHRLHKIAPVYYVAGNHEIDNPERFDGFCRSLVAMGVNVLRNERVTLSFGGDRVNLYGAELGLEYYRDENNRFSHLAKATAADMEKLLGKADEGCNLLICHNPLFFDEYAKWGADVVFSGHCHGGVVRLPLIGGILSPERKFFPKYTKGIYRRGRAVMLLTAGLGKFRLNNPSEIAAVIMHNA